MIFRYDRSKYLIMNNFEALNILDQSWSKKDLLEKIKSGKSSDQIVQEFIKENQYEINTLMDLLKSKDKRILNHMETLNNCEIKLINELKIKNNDQQSKDITKLKKDNPLKKSFEEFNLLLFMNKWSNKFVIGILIMISLLSLTKQAWA